MFGQKILIKKTILQQKLAQVQINLLFKKINQRKKMHLQKKIKRNTKNG